ncbi:relaxase domain-containing protein [Actinoplanes derwentensis]|uniref:TrwC relaxase n=2 Tax=Actinoplanes derwentensis TaxID=113562 RepID=A0A1H2DDB2_9ACTN|nr:relaxase domain-containing protein [Actinoplanes derwentensis]SDT80236.1 TrwC relaxase [Actinoplanes derwentensis]
MIRVTTVGPAGTRIEDLLQRQFGYQPPDDHDGPAVARAEWFGDGLYECGLEPGTVVGGHQIAAVRALLSGYHPATGELLVTVPRATDPRATLPAGPLVDSIEAGRQRLTGTGAVARFGRLQRGVARARTQATPEYRASITDLARIAQAAGIDMGALYPADVLATARDYARTRVAAGNRGYDVLFILPEPVGVLMTDAAFADVAAEVQTALLSVVREAAGVLQQRAGHGPGSRRGQVWSPRRTDTTGLLGWITLHRTACPSGGPAPVAGLHVHVTLANMARRTDGTWSALGADRRDIERVAGTIGRSLAQRLLQVAGEPWAERASTKRLKRFAEDWADRLLATGPLTDAGKAEVVDAVRRCYGHADVPWHGRVLWAPSPSAGQTLATEHAQRHTPLVTRVRTVKTLAGQAAGTLFGAVCRLGLTGFVFCAAIALTLMVVLPGDPLTLDSIEVDRSKSDLSWYGLWIGGAVGGLATMALLIRLGLFRDEIVDVRDAPLLCLWQSLMVTVIGTLGVLTGLAFFMIPSLMLPESSVPDEGWITTLLTAVLAPTFALFVAIDIAKRLRTDPIVVRYIDPTAGNLDDQLGIRLKQISAANPAAGRGWILVQETVQTAVSGIHRAIELAVRGAAIGGSIAHRYPIGCFGSPTFSWPAELGGATWMIGTGTAAPAHAAAVVSDFVAASRTGWWWPHTEFVVISEQPTVVRRESGRLHDTGGPAAQWADGFQVHPARSAAHKVTSPPHPPAG